MHRPAGASRAPEMPSRGNSRVGLAHSSGRCELIEAGNRPRFAILIVATRLGCAAGTGPSPGITSPGLMRARASRAGRAECRRRTTLRSGPAPPEALRRPGRAGRASGARGRTCGRPRSRRPARAFSSTMSDASAIASGWLSGIPSASRRRASSAAVKIRSRSASLGVSCIRRRQALAARETSP